MNRGTGTQGYAKAVLASLAAADGKPVPEAALARAVLKVVGTERCIAVRRGYTRRAWVTAGHSRKTWKPGDVTLEREAALGASIFVRRTVRGLIKAGLVKKKVANGERIYSLVASKAAPRKKEEG